jgi:hypothetical protein
LVNARPTQRPQQELQAIRRHRHGHREDDARPGQNRDAKGGTQFIRQFHGIKIAAVNDRRY